jgi:hypothetical protein
MLPIAFAESGCSKNRENIVEMQPDIHHWWHLISAAATAALIDVGPERLGLLLIEVFCAVAAWHALRAPEGKRWAAIRNQWMAEIRGVFIILFLVGFAVFGYELMWNQPNQSRFRRVADSLSNPLAAFNRMQTIAPVGATNAFFSGRRRPACVQVPLPRGFQGGSYKLPFRPVAPSLPALYDNGSARRRGLDYTVSDGTIVVNFQPTSKDSLSVWYTTDDPVPMILP